MRTPHGKPLDSHGRADRRPVRAPGPIGVGTISAALGGRYMECGKLLNAVRRRGLRDMDYGQMEELCAELVVKARRDRRTVAEGEELVEACIECLWDNA